MGKFSKEHEIDGVKFKYRKISPLKNKVNYTRYKRYLEANPNLIPQYEFYEIIITKVVNEKIIALQGVQRLDHGIELIHLNKTIQSSGDGTIWEKINHIIVINMDLLEHLDFGWLNYRKKGKKKNRKNAELTYGSACLGSINKRIKKKTVPLRLIETINKYYSTKRE